MTTTGDDGVDRCSWALSAPDYMAYHDEEWGVPVHDDRGLYEKLCLEAFQSGLSWLTILRKREGFRAAFAHFDSDREAAIANARAAQDVALDELLWSFAPERPQRPRTAADVPAKTPESTAMAKE